jgi:pimeloyl-ACP methyl ester carboxylesterase
MVLVGTSLGSAVATHFAMRHHDAVAGLVMAGPQVYVDGIGPMASMPRLLSYLGVQVRLSPWQHLRWQDLAYLDLMSSNDDARCGIPPGLHKSCAVLHNERRSAGVEKRAPPKHGQSDGVL